MEQESLLLSLQMPTKSTITVNGHVEKFL